MDICLFFLFSLFLAALSAPLPLSPPPSSLNYSATMSALTFVSSAPGKLILAGEHSVVHQTRALATVIDKRTYCQFDFVPAAAAAAAAGAALTVTLCIQTKQLDEKYEWNYDELHEKAQTMQIPTSLPQLLASLDAFKQSLSSLRHAESIAPQVFLLYYFVLLRGGSLSAPYTRGSLTVTIRSQLPMSAGLGSSAAYTSSLCSGFIWLALQLARRAEPNAAAAGLRAEKDGYLGEQCSCEWAECEYVIPRTAGMAAAAAALGSAAPAAAPTFQPCTHLKSIMNVWAYEGEKIIHGNPSGVDNTCAVYGGVIVYRKGSEISFLQSVPRLGILVVNTRVPRDTKKLVAGVGALKAAFPAVVQPLLDSIDAIVGEWLALLRPDAADEDAKADAAADAAAPPAVSTSALPLHELESRVGALMRVNQGVLCGLGVGHPAIDRVLQLAAAHGFDAGKLTGAGGGGCVIVLQPTAAAVAPAADFATVPAAAAAPSPAAASSAAALAAFTSELQSQLGCEYLETIVGQAGVWIRGAVTLDQLPELQLQ